MLNTPTSQTLVRLEVPGITGVTAEVSDHLRRAVATTLAAFALTLDLTIVPVVELVGSEGDDVLIFVNGRRCRYPSDLPMSVHTYLTGFASSGTFYGRLRSWISAALDPGSAETALAAEYLGLLTVQAVEPCASVLLATGWPPDPADDDDEQARCLTAQRRLLDLGLPAGDLDRVRTVLREHGDVDGAVEQLVAERAADEWAVLISPGYLRELSLADIADPGKTMRWYLGRLADELAFPVPRLHFVSDPDLREGCFRFRTNRTTTTPFVGVPADRLLLYGATPEQLAADAAALDPAATWHGTLVRATGREILEARGFIPCDAPTYIGLTLDWMIRRRARRLVTTPRVSEALDRLQRQRPAQVLMARRRLQLATMTVLLRELADEGVPTKDFPAILDRLLEYDICGQDANTGRLEWTRAGLRETIGSVFSTGFRTIKLHPLGAAAQASAISWLTSGGTDDFAQEAFLAALRPVAIADITMPVLVADEARAATWLAARWEFPDLRVLGAAELPADFIREEG